MKIIIQIIINVEEVIIIFINREDEIQGKSDEYLFNKKKDNSKIEKFLNSMKSKI